jgi:toxin FitB
MILDSNIIIYSARVEYLPLRDYLQARLDQTSVSSISTLEVLGFSRLSVVDKQIFENYFANVRVLPITNEVIEEAIRLRQQRKRSLGDSIIAATALLYNLPVLTNNEADFTDIAGLTVISMASVLA